ncbi:putative transcriptional regulator [Mycolicibacterium rhodesiae NBB3]|uniref:Putative transcriptional regulator n=1 Tax=Mycolicibacterium rhodesiae (strain NBB3) TaxID=710685 RepID=G8RHL3_MYCRN|nr:putative transcriptional regulator [Mycolicibacterium rhodesiae NBB3]
MDEETDTAAGPRRRRDRLPRNRQRERVLRMVREHGGAIDAVELASRMKLHVTTVRFHLDALCDEGAIERTRVNRDGVGRPRTGYRAVEERLDYRILAEILAMELGETAETRARRAQRAGVQWAERIAAAQPEAVVGQDGTEAAEAGDALARGAALATEVFDRMGFDAELAAGSEPSASLSADSEQVLGRERVIRLHACPVRDLARAHPEVGCGLHLGLLQGLVDRAAAAGGSADREVAAVSARLEPFVEPELCIARLAAREDPPVIEVRPRRKRRK